MKAHCNAKRLAALLAVAALVLCCLLALLRPRAVTTAAPVDGAIPLPVVMYHHVPHHLFSLFLQDGKVPFLLSGMTKCLAK